MKKPTVEDSEICKGGGRQQVNNESGVGQLDKYRETCVILSEGDEMHVFCEWSRCEPN